MGGNLMGKSKIFLTTALIIFLVAIATISVSADTNKNFVEPNGDLKAKLYTDAKLDKTLKNKLKYPDELIDSLNRSVKVEMVESNAKFGGYAIKTYKVLENDELKLLKTDKFTSDSTEFQALSGGVPSGRLQIITGHSTLAEYFNKERFYVWTQAEWNSDYAWELTDRFGFAYSSEFEWDGRTNGAFSCHHYDAQDNSYLSGCSSSPVEQNFAGAVWSIDIYNGTIDGITLSGKIATKNNNETNDIKYGEVQSKYAHDTWYGNGITANLGYVSVSYGGDSDVQYATDAYSFSYVE